MENDVTSVLDRLAPVHTTRKRIGQNSASELSSEAVEAKLIRRRCEKQFKKTRRNRDRLLYRRAVRAANQLIIASAQENNQSRLSEAIGDQKLMWKTSNSILHRKSEPDGCCDPAQQINLCTSFTNFFIDKLLRIWRDISSRLTTTTISTTFSSYSLKCSLHLSGFPPVSRMKWPPSSIPPGARPLLSTKLRLLFSNDVLVSSSHRWLIWPIFPSRTECSLQDSSWATSFHSSRRRDQMFRIHPTTVRLPTWSLFQRCLRGWFWFESDLMYTCQSSSVHFSRHTDEGTPPRLL